MLFNTNEELIEGLVGRLKLVPNLAEGGGWFVRKTVGTKPAIVANQLKQAQYCGEGYVEIDVDIEVSAAARHILGVVKPLAAAICIDLAFTIEGRNEGELPERLVGGVRLHRFNLSDERLQQAASADRPAAGLR